MKEELVAADLQLEAGVDMSAPGRRALISQPEEVRDIKIQSVGYLDNGFEARISLPALNSTNICPVQIHCMGKALPHATNVDALGLTEGGAAGTKQKKSLTCQGWYFTHKGLTPDLRDRRRLARFITARSVHDGSTMT